MIGASGVTFFDLTHAQVRNASRFNINNVYLTYLTRGDVISLADQSVRFSPSKTPLSGHEDYDDVLTSDDVFYGASSDSTRKPEFVRVATSVFDARHGRKTYGTTHERHPRFRVDFTAEASDAVGYVERHTSFHSDIHSYKNLRVDIYEG